MASTTVTTPRARSVRDCVGWASTPPTLAPSPRGREAQDELRGLERDVELGAVADALELDPLRPRQPLVAVASRGGGPCEQLVGGAPDDPNGTADPLRVERPALAQRPVDQGNHRLAACGAPDLVCEQLGRDVLEARRDVLRRAAAAL